MDNSLGNLLLIALVIWVLIALLFVVFLVAVAFFALRWLQRYIAPDIADMNKKLAALRAANPGVSTDVLVRRIVRQQALKAGIVGAITGIGGFVTLPITLPIDLIASLR